MDCLDHKKTLLFALLSRKLSSKGNLRLHFRRQRMPLMIEKRDNVYYLSCFGRVNRALKIVWMIEIWEQEGNFFPVAASVFNTRVANMDRVEHISQAELCLFAEDFIDSLNDFL